MIKNNSSTKLNSKRKSNRSSSFRSSSSSNNLSKKNNINSSIDYDEESDDMTDSLDEHWKKERKSKQDKNSGIIGKTDDKIDIIVENITKSINNDNYKSDDSSDDSFSNIIIRNKAMQQQQNDNKNTDLISLIDNEDIIIEDLTQQRALQPEELAKLARDEEIDADDEFEEGGYDPNSTAETLSEGEDHIKVESDSFISPRVKHVLTMDALFMLVMLPVCYMSFLFPSTFMGDEHFYKYWYYNFQWSKFFLWMVCIIIGFAYVAMVTEKRSYPFHCRYKRHRDFIQLLVSAALMFIISPSRTLMGPNDLENHSIHVAFAYNYFSFVLPYLIGLHYTYLDYNLFLRSVGDKFGTPSLWYTYQPKEIATIIPIILFILSLIVWHVYLIIINKLWEYFLIAYGIFFFILIGVSLAVRKTYYLHMHHYFIFGSMIPLSCFQNPLSALSMGVITGISVEGVSRWSYGWLWYRGTRVL